MSNQPRTEAGIIASAASLNLAQLASILDVLSDYHEARMTKDGLAIEALNGCAAFARAIGRHLNQIEQLAAPAD